MATPTIARLKSVGLFSGCSRAQLTAIDRLGVTLDLPAGATLCTEAHAGAEFFVLLAGLAEVRTVSGTAAVLRPGAWFGEIALIEHAPGRHGHLAYAGDGPRIRQAGIQRAAR